ncbi:MAG: RDD family protein [Bacteroidota bacterium]
MNQNDEILDEQESEVTPEEFLASKGTRFANYLIDSIVAIVLVFGLLFLFGPEEMLLNDGGVSFNLMTYAVMIGYFVLFEGTTGKTPGKYITGTKVVTIHGDKPTLLNIVGRSFCRLIPFEAFSFLGARGVGWHDSISKTYVVKDEFNKGFNYV